MLKCPREMEGASMKPPLALFLMVALLTLAVVPVSAEQRTLFVQSAHYGFSGVIAKIKSGMFSLRFRSEKFRMQQVTVFIELSTIVFYRSTF